MSETNGISAGQDTAQAAAEEKLFRQAEINEIVKRAKHDAVESFKRMQVEQPQYAQQKFNEPVQQDQRQQTTAQISSDEIRKLAAEEAQRLRSEWLTDAQTKQQEAEAQRIANEFFNKLSSGKEKYQDFDSVANIDFARFPNAIQLANSYIDNTADVVYELGRDRTKLAMLEQLAHLSPQDAIAQIKRLSQTIKENETASKARTANEPLSHLRTSNAGTDSGVMSMRDLKAKYRG